MRRATAIESSRTIGFSCSTSTATYAPTSAPAMSEFVSMRRYCIEEIMIPAFARAIYFHVPLDVVAEVISNVHLSSDYNVLALAAPEIAERALPGQFVMVKAGDRLEPLLRRPFSVFEVLRERGQIFGLSLLSKRIGPSTTLIYDAKPGDRISVSARLDGRSRRLLHPTRHGSSPAVWASRRSPRSRRCCASGAQR